MIFGSKKSKPQHETIVVGYDYSDREHRQATASALFQKAKDSRTVKESEWKIYNDYYNFYHRAAAEYSEFCQSNELPWTPAVMPDPWIAVESQIDPNVPEPEFRGRDDDEDSTMAKMREYCVRYVCENNRIDDLNTRNERRLLKYGDAFWKAYWDNTMRCGINEGDIRVKDIPVDALFVDPAAVENLEDAEYVDYVYRLHKVKFIRLYGKALKKLGIDPSEIASAQYVSSDGLFDMTTAIDNADDTVQILEHWYRQPEELALDGETIPAGAMACTIQAGGVELKYIPNYWENTGRQCSLFPFVHYWRICDENEFYNKSELFAILPLVDGADRKLATTILNDAMMANDIVLAEEDAFADGCEPANEPGAIWYRKRGKDVARLGGLQSGPSNTQLVNWFSEQIQRANRNFDTNQGKETTRQTTASGIAMLRSDANEQGNIKNSDRIRGYERLYELIDWLALEFFDDDRQIYLGIKKNVRESPVNIVFNSSEFSDMTPEILDEERSQVVRPAMPYWPRIDVTVTAGDSVAKNKQATLDALTTLTQANVTPENHKLYEAIVEYLDIPQKQEIIDDWEQRFNQQPPEQINPAEGLPIMSEGGMPL